VGLSVDERSSHKGEHHISRYQPRCSCCWLTNTHRSGNTVGLGDMPSSARCLKIFCSFSSEVCICGVFVLGWDWGVNGVQ